jgi:uncharacterized phage-like protein YoqJ
MIFAGTGHRPDKLGGYGKQDELEAFAHKVLDDYRPELVISGMALGWDQALVEAALQLGISCHAYVPFAGQELSWPHASQARYRHYLENVEKVVIVTPGEYRPWKMQVRNEAMVRCSDYVLALWDGSPGGTGNCVQFAESIDKPVINVWGEWEKWTGSVFGVIKP